MTQIDRMELSEVDPKDPLGGGGNGDDHLVALLIGASEVEEESPTS